MINRNLSWAGFRMLNILWGVMMLIGIIWGAFHGRMAEVTEGALSLIHIFPGAVAAERGNYGGERGGYLYSCLLYTSRCV